MCVVQVICLLKRKVFELKFGIGSRIFYASRWCSKTLFGLRLEASQDSATSA